MHHRFVHRHPVVDRIREVAREKAMVAELPAMDPGVEDERIDLGEHAIKKYPPTPSRWRS